MQDNFEVNNNEIQQVRTDECIIAGKVYGKCRQQDCLRPIDANTTPTPGMIQIDSSRLGETEEISGGPLTGTITPNSIISFDDTVAGVQLVPNTFRLSDIRLQSIQPSIFSQDGFYDVTIRYTFSYQINLLDDNGDPIPVTQGTDEITDIAAYTTYTKTVSLFGGEASTSTIATLNTLYSDTASINEGNIPYVSVQGIANPLSINIGTYVVNGDTEYHADVTIGLFTIIKLFRLVNMLVASAGDCDIPVCEPFQTSDPCEYFSSLPFPFDDFNPPSNVV
ncbi:MULTISPECIES: hypothetical protein [Clostridium]|jgi:hypothetical protein|uniref:Uncharacterized protein n=2 Tax=Clostridium TaxID=1485 RepID=A0A151ARH4_9CLOT|nr:MULTISPECIES: hypothetical protein [Clostridium]KYH30180.1 hypothetical protein CLCOL_01180 [Clostridium colicanis DSM 13634]MBE6044590.1 hypothetical protein [Clostridium thermopalmarium]PRR76677.1 hypothetical protein CPAL_00620 [Clostridium thermopalmarium DSM 5974]PVZ23012.1 hypothetical protein LX19_01666 [Clostridium thermopalmarium DSM 5974]